MSKEMSYTETYSSAGEKGPFQIGDLVRRYGCVDVFSVLGVGYHFISLDDGSYGAIGEYILIHRPKPEPVAEPVAEHVDTIKRPDHYSRFVIEPATFSTANRLGFLEGNVVKYTVRAPYKNGREDLLKARRCIDMLIEQWDRDARVAAGEKADDVWKVIL